MRKAAGIMNVRIIVGGCLLTLMSFACGSVYAADQTLLSTGSEKVQTFVFNCDDNYSFVARVEGDEVWLFLPSLTQALQQTAPNIFHNGNLMFRLNGQEGLLEESGGVSRNCRNDRRQAIWEHAKLNGADFRAVGNEPGWNLEIREQSKVVLVTGYGSKRYEFDLLILQTDRGARTTVYTADQDGQQMTLSISGKSCSDSMSGEQFESTVEIDLQGEILRGCGKALH